METRDKTLETLGCDQDDNQIEASNYAEKKLVLYFYPKGSSPGCTTEAYSFGGNFYALKKNGCEILGVSINDQKSHKKFREKNQLPFPLIADTDKRLVVLFRVWDKKTLVGEKYMGVFRTTFIVDESG